VQHQAAAIACVKECPSSYSDSVLVFLQRPTPTTQSVLEDENDDTNSTAVVMPLNNVVKNHSVNDVAINPELSAEQINEV